MNDIVKVQRPLVPTSAPWMIYARGHKNMVMQTPEGAAIRAMGHDYKAYFWAEWNSELHRWTLLGRVADEQDW